MFNTFVKRRYLLNVTAFLYPRRPNTNLIAAWRCNYGLRFVYSNTGFQRQYLVKVAFRLLTWEVITVIYTQSKVVNSNKDFTTGWLVCDYSLVNV